MEKFRHERPAITSDDVISYAGGDGNVSVNDLALLVKELINLEWDVHRALEDVIDWKECFGTEETSSE
jgi:hypothetical protein